MKSERNQQGISVVSYTITSAFNTPISSLASILSEINETYLILGASGHIDLKANNKIVHMSVFTHKSGPIVTKQIFRYFLLQAKIIQEILSSRKKVVKIIFFREEPPLLPMIVAKVLNKKVYWLLPSMISILSNNFSAKASSILSKLCFNMSNAIILYSKSLIEQWGLENYRKKIVIAHRHFINFNEFTTTIPMVDRPYLIGYIGRLSSEKGVLNFAQALPDIFNHQERYHALIGGDGPLKDKIIESIGKSESATRVFFPGWIHHDNLPDYLNQLRLLVIPSYTEGLPNIMLEAMACGTPVLASPVGAIPDVIINGKTGFILEDQSPNSIAESVNNALNSPELYQIAENGKRFVENNYSFIPVVSRWKNLLEEI